MGMKDYRHHSKREARWVRITKRKTLMDLTRAKPDGIRPRQVLTLNFKKEAKK